MRKGAAPGAVGVLLERERERRRRRCRVDIGTGFYLSSRSVNRVSRDEVGNEGEEKARWFRFASRLFGREVSVDGWTKEAIPRCDIKKILKR